MQQIEKEVKVLNINKDIFIEKLNNLGAIFKCSNKQILYTYDLFTIYSRYRDALYGLESENIIKNETARNKLKLLFFEIDNFLTKEDKNKLKDISGFSSFSLIGEADNLISILKNKKLDKFMQDFKNNDNKWIRVRQTGNQTTIAVKHILANDNGENQNLLETELEVASFSEANKLLEALGYCYKSYQEKERLSYLLDGYQIDIDTWPGIPTYIEIEFKSKRDLEKLIKKLGFKMSDCISCTADEVYRKYNKSMFDMRELKF